MSLEISNMRSINRTARIVGVLFIIGTVAGILSSLFMKPILGSPDYLIKFSANQNQVLMGALFVLIMAAACASIAIWLYPILKNYSESSCSWSSWFQAYRGSVRYRCCDQPDITIDIKPGIRKSRSSGFIVFSNLRRIITSRI